MYIEMTSFAIPTFLIEGLKFAGLVIGAWILVVFIGIIVYNVMEK
jgi:hypothetical protein